MIDEDAIHRDWTRVGYTPFFALRKGDYVPGRGVILGIDACVIKFSNSQPAKISSERWGDATDGFVGVYREHAFIIDEDPDIHDGH